jgi:hypothetical protein
MILRIKTDPEKSYVQGRNGLTYMSEAEVLATDETVSIGGIAAKRGNSINGCTCMTVEAMDELAEKWISARISMRLEYLRGELQAGCISYGELAELQSLVEYIEPGDVELLEAAGVPEFPETWNDEVECTRIIDQVHEEALRNRPDDTLWDESDTVRLLVNFIQGISDPETFRKFIEDSAAEELGDDEPVRQVIHLSSGFGAKTVCGIGYNPISRACDDGGIASVNEIGNCPACLKP